MKIEGVSGQTPTPSKRESRNKRQELDNLIKKELNVGDPQDPNEVASALNQGYSSSESSADAENSEIRRTDSTEDNSNRDQENPSVSIRV